MDDGLIRIIIFSLTLITLGLLESSFEYRKRVMKIKERWPANLSMIVLSTLIIRLIFPLGAIGVALWSQKNNIGLFHWLNLSEILSIILTILVMDFIIYSQHIAFHKFNKLWKFHQVHHSDRDLDITSALRFHPVEMIISLAIKALTIIIIGAHPKGILIFEIVLSSMAIFNHANIYIHPSLEKVLRYFVVTPQMHIIHHSEEQFESNSNYGFNLSLWDRLFRTYTNSWISKKVIGQKMFQRASDQRIVNLLKQPFKNH